MDVDLDHLSEKLTKFPDGAMEGALCIIESDQPAAASNSGEGGVENRPHVPLARHHPPASGLCVPQCDDERDGGEEARAVDLTGPLDRRVARASD